MSFCFKFSNKIIKIIITDGLILVLAIVDGIAFAVEANRYSDPLSSYIINYEAFVVCSVIN